MSFTQVRSWLFNCSFLLVFFGFSACDSFEKANTVNYKPATGSLSEIVTVSSSYLLDSASKREIVLSLSPYVKSLPNPERYFSVLYAHESIFQDYFKHHFNMVVFVTQSMLKKESHFPFIPASIKQKWSVPPKVGTMIKTKDIWANGQSVIFVYVRNKASFLPFLKSEQTAALHLTLLDIESQLKYPSLVGKGGGTFEKDMLAERGFCIKKPLGYRVARTDSNFVWLRKTGSKADYGIFIYHEPYVSLDQAELGRVIYHRNEILKPRIAGPTDGSYMSTETYVKPTVRTANIRGRYTREVRGWWKMENDFMGGPFVSYTVIDTTLNKVITLEGNVYAPNKDKWEHLRELELILQSYSTHD